jgi:hypothetical protein
MKTYEMIEALYKNPKLRFASSKEEKQVFAKTSPFCIGYMQDGRFNLLETCERDLLADWEVINEPVTFMTAIHSFCEGKTIKCELNNSGARIYNHDITGKIIDHLGDCITCYEIVNGKWYIE